VAKGDGLFEVVGEHLYGGLYDSLRWDKIPHNGATILKNIDLRRSVNNGGLTIRKGYDTAVTGFLGTVNGILYAHYGSTKKIYFTTTSGLYVAVDTGVYPLTASALTLPTGITLSSDRNFLAQLRGKVVVTGCTPAPFLIDIATDATSLISGFPTTGTTAAPRHCIAHLSRMFMCGSATDPFFDSRVWFSAVGDATDFTTANNAGYIDIWATRPLVGLASAGDALLVFSQSAIYTIVGENPFNFAVYKVADLGAQHGHGVTSVHREACFASPTGLYLVQRRQGMRRISQPIQRAYDASDLTKTVVTFDPYLGEIWLILFDTTYKTFVYNIELGAWRQHAYADAFTLMQPAVPMNAMLGSSSAGFRRINHASLTTDAGTTISAEYQSPILDAGEDVLISPEYVYLILDSGGAAPASAITHTVLSPSGASLATETITSAPATDDKYIVKRLPVHKGFQRGVLYDVSWSDAAVKLTGFKFVGKIESQGGR